MPPPNPTVGPEYYAALPRSIVMYASRFPVQQGDLALQTTGVTGQRACAAHHAVAGHARVAALPHDVANSPGCARPSGHDRDVPVRGHPSDGDSSRGREHQSGER